MTSPPPSPIPLIHNGDSYHLYVSSSSRANTVSLLTIEVFPDNTNVKPYQIKFADLDPGAKRAVISQVNRRFEGKVVEV